MGRISKIQRYGVEDRIRELLAGGMITCDEITQALHAEGVKISRATVARWLKMERESRREETAKVVRDHVQKVVPADLEALEEMEQACLERSRETKGDFAHRLAEQNIAQDLDKWLSMLEKIRQDLQAADPDETTAVIRRAVTSIVAQCLIYISNDFTLEKMRNSARRTAAMIIDLKLKHALGGEGASNILIAPLETSALQGKEVSDGDDGCRLLTFGGEA